MIVMNIIDEREDLRDLHHGKYDSQLCRFVAEREWLDYDDEKGDFTLCGWAGRLGKRIHYVDSQGFHYLWKYATESEAMAEFDALDLPSDSDFESEDQ